MFSASTVCELSHNSLRCACCACVDESLQVLVSFALWNPIRSVCYRCCATFIAATTTTQTLSSRFNQLHRVIGSSEWHCQLLSAVEFNQCVICVLPPYFATLCSRATCHITQKQPVAAPLPRNAAHLIVCCSMHDRRARDRRHVECGAVCAIGFTHLSVYGFSGPAQLPCRCDGYRVITEYERWCLAHFNVLDASPMLVWRYLVLSLVLLMNEPTAQMLIRVPM